jgi:hypothetical protein
MDVSTQPPIALTATTIRRRRMNARLPFVVVAVFAAYPHDIIAPAGYKNCTRIGETTAPPRGEKLWEKPCNAK